MAPTVGVVGVTVTTGNGAVIVIAQDGRTLESSRTRVRRKRPLRSPLLANMFHTSIEALTPPHYAVCHGWRNPLVTATRISRINRRRNVTCVLHLLSNPYSYDGLLSLRLGRPSRNQARQVEFGVSTEEVQFLVAAIHMERVISIIHLRSGFCWVFSCATNQNRRLDTASL